MVAALFNDGDQLPVNGVTLFDDSGNFASVSPEHNGATGANVGVAFWFTVIVNVVVAAHNPAVGVNV